MDMQSLENRLCGRLAPEPSTDFRRRVIGAVAAELARPLQASPVWQWDNRYWATIAAGVLIILNVSMISASQNEFSIWPIQTLHQMTAETQALHQLELQQEGLFK